MSTEISKQSTLSIPRSLKAIGIIDGLWTILTIVGAVIAYIPRHPDFWPFCTYLSNIQRRHAHCRPHSISCQGVNERRDEFSSRYDQGRTK